MIYNSANSPRNDQYCFTMQTAKAVSSGMNGLGDLDGIIQEKLNAQQREYKIEQLSGELQATKQKLVEAEEYVGVLEGKLELSGSTKFKLGNLDLVELGGIVLENFANKNAGMLGKFGLSGPTEELEIPHTAVSFKRKTDQPDQAIPPQFAQYIPFINRLEAAFSPEELNIVVGVLQKLADEPQQLPVIADLLNVKIP